MCLLVGNVVYISLFLVFCAFFIDWTVLLMEKKGSSEKEYYAIDLAHIFKTLWSKAWAIILVAMILATVFFSYSSFALKPKYSSSILLYVNNSSFSLGSTEFTISSNELSAAQSLVKTYAVLLNNRTTLERAIEKADVPYTYEQLSGMIVASPVNTTEVMKVTVTTEDPYEAAKIANCIAEVLPIRISEIIEGASMEVVDSAVPNLQKVAPSVTTYTLIGFLLGAFAAVAVITVIAIRDDSIHDEEYILKNYKYPILAKVPNLHTPGNKDYGYYSKKKKTAK